MDLSITCEERRGRGEERRGERGEEGEGGDKRRGGTRGFILTFGTPRLASVVHVGAIATGIGSIPSERATLKSRCAAASAGNINCPSTLGSSIVNECDDD